MLNHGEKQFIFIYLGIILLTIGASYLEFSWSADLITSGTILIVLGACFLIIKFFHMIIKVIRWNRKSK